MKKVFVVDDSGPYRMLLRELLKREGHEVIEAGNGEEAINQIRQKDFHADMLLLDLQMPHKDGFEVLRILSRMKSKTSIPVLVMSGIHNSIEEIDRVRKMGALGFIDKTLNLDELLYRINQVLNPVKHELRASSRTAVTLLVQYRIGEKYRTAYTFNLSEGGVFIRMMNPPPLDTQVHVRFNLPNSNDLIRVDGIVRWQNTYNPSTPKLYPPGIGVQFLNLQDKDLAKIKGYLLEVKTKSVWKDE